MRKIKNKTHGALRVHLSRGKILHLGPLKTGQISVHDVDHPPLLKMVEAGQVELLADTGSRGAGGRGGGTAPEDTQGHHPASSVHRSGDR